MFPRQVGQLKDSIFTVQKSHRGKEREHHVGWPFREFEGTANPGFVGRMIVEPGEEIEPHEGGGQQVGGEEAVALAVDRGRVGFRLGGQGMHALSLPKSL